MEDNTGSDRKIYSKCLFLAFVGAGLRQAYAGVCWVRFINAIKTSFFDFNMALTSAQVAKFNHSLVVNSGHLTPQTAVIAEHFQFQLRMQWSMTETRNLIG